MLVCVFLFFQAEDGIRDLVRSRGLGDVYKRQRYGRTPVGQGALLARRLIESGVRFVTVAKGWLNYCLLYTSDAADERSSVDLGGRRIIKKKKTSTSQGRNDMECKDITTGRCRELNTRHHKKNR